MVWFTGLESDSFKFHLRRLQDMALVVKAVDGLYQLTAEGKEFANRLDETNGLQLAQPKVSMLLYVTTKSSEQELLLAHQRLRQPFYEYWGIASAPVAWGVSLVESAKRELHKQAGLVVDFEPFGHLRVTDVSPNGDILEDKLFVVMKAEINELKSFKSWHGGTFAWLSAAELLARAPLFPTTRQTISMVRDGLRFAEATCMYDSDEY